MSKKSQKHHPGPLDPTTPTDPTAIGPNQDPATAPTPSVDREKITELTNDLQRTRADFENFRRRTEERQANLANAARHDTVFKLLPLLDDFDRAIATYTELAPLQKSFDKSLQSLGLSRVEAAPGIDFNPDLHEAVSAIGDGEHEVISEVLRPGYYYNGDLLRAAMVKVERQSTDNPMI